MSTEQSLVPLRKTLDSLREIRSALIPYLKLLRRHRDGGKKSNSRPSDARDAASTDGDGGVDPHRLAEARAAVALAAGTLRYMAARLRGRDVKKDDPLRMELDKTRKMLVTLRGLERKGKGGGAAEAAAATATATAAPKKKEEKKPVAQAPPPSQDRDDAEKSRGGSAGKEGKILDVQASERMVKAALGGPGTAKGEGNARTTAESSPPSPPHSGGKRKKSRSRSRSRSPVRDDGGRGKGQKKKKQRV